MNNIFGTQLSKQIKDNTRRALYSFNNMEASKMDKDSAAIFRNIWEAQAFTQILAMSQHSDKHTFLDILARRDTYEDKLTFDRLTKYLDVSNLYQTGAKISMTCLSSDAIARINRYF